MKKISALFLLVAFIIDPSAFLSTKNQKINLLPLQEISYTGTLSTSETGTTVQFFINLDSEPVSLVTIDFESSNTDEGIIDPESVVFTPENWFENQTITITGQDDYIVDGDIPYVIRVLPAVSEDPSFSGLDYEDIPITNEDNDVAGILVTPTSGLITMEDGTEDTFSVQLTSEPIEDVTINLTSSNEDEGIPSPTTLLFTPSNWSNQQIVSVIGQNDFIVDGPIDYIINTDPTESADPIYNGINPDNISVTNQDNDVAGFEIIPITGLVTSEDGDSDTFTITLTSQPTDQVSLPIFSSDLNEGTISQNTVLFQPIDWNTPQTITITGVDDHLDDGNMIYQVITGVSESNDGSYHRLNPDNPFVTNLDNDDSPVAINDVYNNIPEDALFSVPAPGILLNDTDINGDELTVILVNDVTNGTLDLSANGSFTYQPNSNFSGTDGFTYIANDGYNDSTTATVSLNIAGSNDVPLGINDLYEIDEDTLLSVSSPGVLLNDFDPDNNDLTAVLSSSTDYGILTLNSNGSFTYQSQKDYFGTDVFSYRAFDGSLYSAVVVVEITINAINDFPVAEPDSFLSNATNDIPLVVSAPGILNNDSDVDNDPLTASVVSSTRHGNLIINSNGSFTYMPNNNFEGDDSFTYRAYDSSQYSQVTTVTITIDTTPPPAPSWVSPIGDDGVITINGGTILFEASLPVPPPDFQKVVFLWWNPNNEQYDILGERFVEPFRITVDSSIFDFQWNQVFVTAYDSLGNISPLNRILIFYNQFIPIYLPLINR
jgi:VCBS repeat-containing protein